MISRKEIEESKYSYVIERGLPDHVMEFFWYGFRDSIYNAINQSNISDDQSDLVKKKLELTRNHLNELQSNQKYDEISPIIQDFIIWVSKHLMISCVDRYNFNILITNVKRWSKWILKKGNQLSYDWLQGNENDYFYIFFEIKHFIYNRSFDKEKELLEFIIQYTPNKTSNNLVVLNNIMEYLVKNRILKPTLLETLNKCCPVIKCLQDNNIIEKDLKLIGPYSILKLLKKYSLLNKKIN